MKLSVLKKKIIKDQIEFHFEVGINGPAYREFKKQIKLEMDECNDVQDVINLMGEYGHDEPTEYVLSFLVTQD
jgi:hypothetical protein